jgi:hypothetical protein
VLFALRFLVSLRRREPAVSRLRRSFRWVLLPALLWALAPAAFSQIRRPPEPDSAYYDIRDQRAAPPPATPAAAAIAAQEDAEPSAGAVYSLAGPLTAAQPGDLEEIARRFLSSAPGQRRPANAFGEGEPELALVGRSRSPRMNLTHLTFQHAYRGIPVFDGEVQAHLDEQGRIWRFTQPMRLPGAPPAASEPAITASEALEKAIEIVLPGENPPVAPLEAESGSERRTIFASAALSTAAPVSLTWFVTPQEVLLAWQMYLDLGGARAYWIVIDARGGRLLFSRNLARQERPAGLVFRAADRASPLKGPQTVEPWTGWPASHGDCPAEVYPQQYRSGSQRDRCWVRDQQAEGNNADVCVDSDGNNVCDARALAVQDRFSFPFRDSFDRENDPAPDRNAALANAFYWANALHDWLYRLGFDEAAGNFQADNFRRGGAAGDALRIDLQDPAALNNATFTTPPDGIAPRMELGLFTGLRRDTAFDADILAHEYVHGLTTRLIGGPDSTNGLALWQSGAMAEGWSDAFAASLTADPVIGEYASRNPAGGIRTVAYDNSPYTFGMFGTLRPTVIANSDGLLLGLPQVHRDGEIWATVLWELRQALGRDVFEQILTAALNLTPRRPSMLDARDAILQAALLAAEGSPNNCGAWAVFAARGFGFSAALNPVQSGQANDTALSVFESFDLPAACGGSPPAPGSLLLEENAESSLTAWTAAGPWHRTSRRSASGGFSWWYGREATATYDTGGRNRGSLTSPPIELGDAAGALLEWDQLLRTEGFNHPLDLDGAFGPYLNADSGRVLVSTDDGSSWRVLTHVAHPTPGSGFVPYRINLSRFAGQTIRLQFDFDTFDSRDNQHEGWYLDNIRVSRLGPEPARLRVDPDFVSFSAGAGGPAPPARTITVSTLGSNGIALPLDDNAGLVWTASVAPGASWLSLLPASGRSPSKVQVSAAIVGLPAGVHRGEVRFYELGRTEVVTTLIVTLTLDGATGPLAAWSFNEGGRGPGISIADGSGRAHAGVTRGAGTDAVPGVAGNARIFDGASGSLEAGASADFTSPSFTLRTWVKLDDYPINLGVIAAALGGGNPQGWFVGVLGTGNVVLMTLGPGNESIWLASRSALAPGQWHAVTVAVDCVRGEAALYLDGELDISTRFSGHGLGASQALTIGRASWWDGYYLAFAIDETLLDSGVWTAAEVRADVASFAPPVADPPREPLAEWRFDETVAGVGTVLMDTSGGGHHATVPNEASRTVPGVQGAARAFELPTGYARIAPHSDLASPGFSFSTWIKLDVFPQNWGVVFSTFDGDYRGWFLGINSDGRVIFSSWGKPAFSAWVLSGRRLQTGQWHHLAVSLDELSGRALIYVDGEADRSFATDGFTPSAAGPTFARASWFDGYYLGCALDEAMLFPAALPAREIRREFERFRIASLLRAAGVGPALRGVRKAVIFQMKPLPREPQRGFARGAAQRSVKANPGESNFDGDL